VRIGKGCISILEKALIFEPPQSLLTQSARKQNGVISV
jgi:hypothetical protein